MTDKLDEINAAIKHCMKTQDKKRLDALRMLKASLLENKTSSAPKAEVEAIVSHYKKLKSSLDAYPQGSPHRDKITEEMVYVEEYLPQPMDEAAVRQAIQAILGKSPSANFGEVMKQLSPNIKGRFDGKRATELVKEIVGSH